ncbi:MAG: urocanate hydratase [Actinomycetia bacterium]|nr:urocanate hydratase [Actinomycetes bacterium]
MFRSDRPLIIGLPEELPPPATFAPGIRRAPDRGYTLTPRQTVLALKNALRYVPPALHEAVAPEFLAELRQRGRIYGYRFRPAPARPGAAGKAGARAGGGGVPTAGPDGNIKARPIDEYQGILEARALQLNIDNNLDFAVALYPYELVTYGETGQVFQNWMQYRLVKQYLEQMTEELTLVVASGHPVGLFPSHRDAPRVIITNGLMVGEFDDQEGFHEAAQLGVANYGQMTAGGWMYIGPQGIVHGTYLTLLNAGRLYLGIPPGQDLAGVLYLSSGLGGMSGAQAKAADIAGAVSVVAEVDLSRIETRHEQGWVQRVTADLDQAFSWAGDARSARTPLSIAYHGNVVDLWQYVVDHEIPVELASDQTSCHAAYEGGYVPQGLDFSAARELLSSDPAEYRRRVDVSLRRQFDLIGIMAGRGTYFWDYGNSFLKAVFEAGVTAVAANGTDTKEGFIYPSYVEHIMGPLCFDRGYGPFRWVCCSLDPADLATTDAAAMNCIDPLRCWQDHDNYCWVRDAGRNDLVVGSQARILYADAEGRVRLGLAFNDLVRRGKIGPVIIGRDHHDVAGADSPYRETSNVRDGSNVMADMAFHCWAGNAARGMTLVVASNGGGVGVGRSISTGFGLVLDGSERVDRIIRSAVEWDVMGGVARRAWARNDAALEVAAAWNAERRPAAPGHITLPHLVEDGLIEDLVERTPRDSDMVAG